MIKTNRKPVPLKLDKQKRNFIKMSSMLGAGLAVSVVAPGAALADSKEPAEQPTGKARGYQLTPHILEYYKSAAS